MCQDSIEKRLKVDKDRQTVCGQHLDTLPGVLPCRRLREELSREEATQVRGTFDDVFSDNVETQRDITTLYSCLLAIRSNILDNESPLEESLVSCTPN